MQIVYFKTKIYDIGEGHVEWNNQIGGRGGALILLLGWHLTYDF